MYYIPYSQTPLIPFPFPLPTLLSFALHSPASCTMLLTVTPCVPLPSLSAPPLPLPCPSLPLLVFPSTLFMHTLCSLPVNNASNIRLVNRNHFLNPQIGIKINGPTFVLTDGSQQPLQNLQ